MTARHGQHGKYLWEIRELLSAGTGSKSTANSSTTPLGSGETFTGTAELNLSPDVMAVVQTDAAGTLFLDFSIDDGANWSSFPVNGFDVDPGINEFHVAVKGPRSFRVRYVNSSSAQTYFRLAIYHGEFGPPNAPLTQSISGDADALIVRSVSSDLDLQRGSFGGMNVGNKFGYTADLDSSIVVVTPATWVDLWSYGGQRTSPSGSFTPFMASDDAADTSLDIEATYQDTAGIEQTVTVATDATDGRTPVSLGVTATDLYRGRNASGTSLVGDVAFASANNFTNGVPDNQSEVLASIPAIDGKTQVLAGRVPSNRERLLQSLRISMARDSGNNGSITCVFQTRFPGETFITEDPIDVTDSTPFMGDLRGVVLPGGTDFRVRIRDVSDNGTTVSGRLLFYDVDA